MKIIADITIFGEKYTTCEINFDSVEECAKYYSRDILIGDVVSFYQELENGEYLVLAEDSIKSAVFKFREVQSND